MSKTYKWDYLHTDAASPMYKEIANLVQKHDIKSVLDLGCGLSRWNEFMPDNYKYSVTGIDQDANIIDQATKRYKTKKNVDTEFIVDDAWNPQWSGKVDAIVMSGLLYYARPQLGNPDPFTFVQKMVKKYKPSYVIIQEPHPSVVHKSPDFIELFDYYGYTVTPLWLDIRLSSRRVYCLYVDRQRPQRKIKAEFVDNGRNIRQQDFDLNRLRFGAYITNTEKLNDERDGLILPASDKYDTYVCVASGYKGIIKGAVDWKPGKKFEYMWIDISPTALDYRMWVDMMIDMNPAVDVEDLVNMYMEQVEPRFQPHYGGSLPHKEMLDKQLDEAGISNDDWANFFAAYAKSPKSYAKLDLVNNIGMLYELIKDKPNVWFWYSNAFDWHQFRYDEKAYEVWCKYLTTRKPDLELHGHTPPFTSSK